MPALRINVTNPVQEQVELVDENSGAIVAKGYLEASMLPANPGDRIGSLVWVATNVLLPDATPIVHPDAQRQV